MFVCFCVYKSKTYSFIRFIGIKVFEYLFIQIYVMENCNSYCEIFYTQSLIRFDIYFTLSSLSLCFFLLWERKSFICCHSLLSLFFQFRLYWISLLQSQCIWTGQTRQWISEFRNLWVCKGIPVCHNTSVQPVFICWSLRWMHLQDFLQKWK